MDITETVSLDSASVRLTQDGYLVALPRVARAGIQLYSGRDMGRPDMDIVRVYRPEDEVFRQDSLRSYAFRPVTNDHPPEQVTADNWRRYSVGQTGEGAIRDGDFVRVPMVLMDSRMIRLVQDGKNQLSLGYSTDVKWESGTAPDGAAYDAVQTNIRANHLAVVPLARGGPKLKIGDIAADQEKGSMSGTLKTITVDGVQLEMSDIAASVVKRALDQAEEELKEEEELKDKATKKADELEEKLEEKEEEIKAKDAEIVTLKKQLADSQITPARLDQLVRDRLDTIDRARAVVGDGIAVDGKTDADIRRQVVAARLGDVAKNWSDSEVAASFNTLAVGAVASQHAAPTGAAALGSAILGSRTTDSATLYDKYERGLSDAWKKPTRAA